MSGWKVIGWFEVEAGSGALHQCLAGPGERRVWTTCGTYGPRDYMAWSNDSGSRCRRCVDKDEDMQLSWRIEREADERRQKQAAT